MTTVEVLRAARARIDTPEKWWQHDGHFGSSAAPKCALLALTEFAGNGPHPSKFALSRAMGGGELYSIDVPRFNDTHTHAEVMAAYDEAIANELAREQEHTASPLEPVGAVVA